MKNLFHLTIGVIIAAAAIVQFSCNDKYDNPVDPKEGTGGGDTTVVDTTGIDTTAIDTTVIDTTVIDTTVIDTTVIDTTVIDTTVIDTTVIDTTVIDTTVIDTTVIDTTVIDTTVVDTSISIDPNAFKVISPQYGAVGENSAFFIKETPLYVIDDDTVMVTWVYQIGRISTSTILSITDTLNFIPNDFGQCHVTASIQIKTERLEIYRDSIPVYSKPTLKVSAITSGEVSPNGAKYDFELSAQVDPRRKIRSYSYATAGSHWDTINTSNEVQVINVVFVEEGQQNIQFRITDDLGIGSQIVDTNIVVEYRPVLKRETDNSSVWFLKKSTDIDTLLYAHNDTSTVIRMSASKAASHYTWQMDSFEQTTTDGILELPWLYHGKVKVICVDKDGITSLPDSFMVFPKTPPRLNFYLSRNLGHVNGPSGPTSITYEVSWMYSNAKIDEITKYSDFYNIINLKTQSEQAREISFTWDHPSYQNATDERFWYMQTGDTRSYPLHICTGNSIMEIKNIKGYTTIKINESCTAYYWW